MPTRSYLDINPSLEVSIALKSSVTLMDFDAMLSRSNDSTAVAPDCSAISIRLAACAGRSRKRHTVVMVWLGSDSMRLASISYK